MEACVRGFSFMPETKVEVGELQYVEGGELSRAWKTKQRERLKDLESKIWDEFVKEQDVVNSICSDDPYQFIQELPNDCMKELIDDQLISKGNEKIEEVNREEKAQSLVTFQMREPRDTMVSFADDDDNDCDIINIFDDDKDEDGSGPDTEVINDSVESPCTVRENQNPETPGNASPESQSKDKSPENESSLIETSIYRAKVKELQSKVNLELLSVITTLEAQDLNKIDPQNLPKLQRQCSEYCARYNRIYLYQLKRQIHVMTRHNNAALPFARHTFLRSQMTRAVSFQQNLFQALQVFHKWFTQKAPLRECVDSLKHFACLVREGDRACPIEVHNEELQQTCKDLDGVLDIYLRRVNFYLNYDNDISARSRKSHAKHHAKKRFFGHNSKSAPKQSTELDTRLSMYSLEKYRAGSKSPGAKDLQTGNTSRVPLNDASDRTNNKAEDGVGVSLKKKTSRSRRPLMRAPGTRHIKREKLRESDNISTMVESVRMCMSSNMSPELTPRHTPRDSPYPSPREKLLIFKGLHKNPVVQNKTPRSPPKRLCPPVLTLSSQVDLKLNLQPAPKVPSETVLLPVIKVQCEKKDSIRRSPTGDSWSPKTYSPDTGSVKESPRLLSPQNKEKDKKGERKIGRMKTEKDDASEVSNLVQSEIKDSSRRSPTGDSWSPKTYSPDTGSVKESPRLLSPQNKEKDKKGERKFSEIKDGESSFEVSKLLRKLCGATSGKIERVAGTRNTQMLNFNGSNPRQPSTPQLLRILEETIQKKVPKPLLCPKPKVKDADKYRMTFNLPAKTADTLLQYRTKFVQHMLSSAMYANSAVGKPWEMIGSVSEQILDDILLSIAKEMQLKDYVDELFISETK